MSCRAAGTRLGPCQPDPRCGVNAPCKARALVFALLAIAVPCSALGQAAPRETAPARANAVQVRAANVDVASEQRKLQIWIGDWTYQGEDRQTSFQSARVYQGKATVRPMLGGAFVEWIGEDDTGDSWREIDGYDSANRRYFWHAYYPDGSVEVMSYRIEGNTVSLLGTTDIGGKPRRLRGTFVFAPDGKSFVEKLQVSVDGKTWIPAWEIRFTKVK